MIVVFFRVFYEMAIKLKEIAELIVHAVENYSVNDTMVYELYVMDVSFPQFHNFREF